MKRSAISTRAFIASCLLICVGGAGAEETIDAEAQAANQAAIQKAIEKGRGGDLNGAIADLTKVIEKDPKNVLAYAQRGFARLDLNKPDDAIVDLNKSLELEPRQPMVLSARAWINNSRGKVDEAIADYNTAIAMMPDNPWFFVGRASCFERKGDFEKAIADHGEAIKLAPKASPFRINRSLIRTLAGDYKGGIEDAKAAIELDSNEPKAFTARANAYKRSGEDPAQALRDCQQAISLDPKFAYAYWLAGGAHVDLGEYEKAIEKFDAALKIDPDYGEAYSGRAMARYAMQDWKKSLADIKKEVADDSELAVYNAYFAWAILSRSGDVAAAEKEVADALAIYSRGRPDPWVETLGKYLLNKATEKTLLETAIVHPSVKIQNTRQCEANFYVGIKKLVAGDKAAALESFKKCVGTQSRNDREFKLAAAEIKFLSK